LETDPLVVGRPMRDFRTLSPKYLSYFISKLNTFCKSFFSEIEVSASRYLGCEGAGHHAHGMISYYSKIPEKSIKLGQFEENPKD